MARRVSGPSGDNEENGADILVVDTLTQSAGLKGDWENNAGAAHTAMEPLQEAADKDLAVVVIRHERKTSENQMYAKYARNYRNYPTPLTITPIMHLKPLERPRRAVT